MSIFEHVDFHPRRNGNCEHLVAYESLCAESGGELRTFARASGKGKNLTIESARIYETQITLNDFFRDTHSARADELAWRLYDAESGELIDELSTRDGRFFVLSMLTLWRFEKWLFPALEALAARQEGRKIAQAIGDARGGAKRKTL